MKTIADMTTRETIEARMDAVATDIEGTTEFVHGGGVTLAGVKCVRRVCLSSEALLSALRCAVTNIDDPRVLAQIEEHLRS